MAKRKHARSNSSKTRHAPPSTPTTASSSARPILNVPPELLMEIFDNLKSSSADLHNVALVCQDWYKIAFPMIHQDLLSTRTLSLKAWTPKSVNTLTSIFAHSPELGNAVKRMTLPDLDDLHLWLGTRLTDADALGPFWMQAFEEALEEDSELDFDDLNDDEHASIFERAVDFHIDARAEALLEELYASEGAEWILDTSLAEKALFDILPYLPHLVKLDLGVFRHHVIYCTEKEYLRKRIRVVRGGETSYVSPGSGDSKFKLQCRMATIWGNGVIESFSNHWRFSGIE